MLITGCAAPIVRDVHKPFLNHTRCSIPSMMAYAGDKDTLYFKDIDKRYNYDGELVMTKNRYIKGEDNFELARSQIISCSERGYHMISDIEKLVLSCANDFTFYKTPLHDSYLVPGYKYPIDPRFIHEIQCSKAGMYSADDALDIYKRSDWMRDNLKEYDPRRKSEDFKIIELALVKHDRLEEERLAYFASEIRSHKFIKAMMKYRELLNRAGGVVDSNVLVSETLEKILRNKIGHGISRNITNEAEYNFVRSTVKDEGILKQIEAELFSPYEGSMLESFSEEAKVRIIESAIEIKGFKKIEVYARTPSRLYFLNANIKDPKAVHHFNNYYFWLYPDKFKHLNNATKLSYIESSIKYNIEDVESKNENLRIDYISTVFSNNYKRHPLLLVVWAGVLRNYNEMNKPSLSLFEAEAYYKLGLRSKAKSLIDNWLSIYGKKNKWYRKVVGLYSKL